ncbi:helix-turn-helix transcriptional regulator [Virgibacillus sp. YIM 98842]|uniref:helix-turn-helix transcriptional regulator n=1 Tax=Virgibacillus sp. YIM 98842 TaxID=2663533 RepID=UPI0013DB5774|nr:helix-turn-helix transcriptional regulator [Virgibacillus sp. YIM 98842]
MSISIGERIRHLRIYRKMSQSELVEGICSVAYLSKIENGKAKPSNQFLEKVSVKLNIEFEMLKNQNDDGFQEEIETILFKMEEQSKALSQEEESLLKMALLEFIPTQLLVRVFTTLFKELVEKKSMIEANKLYDSYYKKLMNETEDLEVESQSEQKNYLALHNVLGKYFYVQQNFNQSDYHYSISETLISDSKDIESAKLYYNISLVKQRILEDKTLALFYSKRSYEIFRRENDLDNLVRVLITMGVQYHLLSKYDFSLKSLREAQKHLEEFQSKSRQVFLPMITYNMGRVYQKLEEYEEAILYYNKSLACTESEVQKCYILKGMLEIRLKKKEWPTVKKLLDETFTLVNKNKLTHMEIELHSIKSKVFKNRGDHFNYEKTIKYAIECAVSEGYTPLIKEMAEELADYYFELRLYKKSSEYYFLALSNS